MSKKIDNDETLCCRCGGIDDSNNAEGPCLACQIDYIAYEMDRLIDLEKEGCLDEKEE